MTYNTEIVENYEEHDDSNESRPRPKNYCENNNSTYIDYHTSMKEERDGVKDEFTYWVEELERYDGVHPNKEGYIHMEKIVSKKIKEIL